ncbi:MAG: ATPase, T2SS/T4P/T4SS family [Candidatus Thorarchaeota archaeon]
MVPSIHLAPHNIITQMELLESYKFRSYVVEVNQEKSTKTLEPLYQVKYDETTYKSLKDFYLYEKQIKMALEEFVSQNKEFCTFNQLFKYLNEIIPNKVYIPSGLMVPIFFRVLGLEKIGPLLMDENIDEIYIDSSHKAIYIDHNRHGRCNTFIKLSKKEIDTFVSRIALENDFSLSQSNPTMKADFTSPLFHTRVTVDIPPLIIEDVHIDIRKFHAEQLRLPDLVEIGSITGAQADFLRYLIQNQTSLSIIGPPNSGKTTLQNALIEYIPSHLRLLSIEDVLESTNLRHGNVVRFRLGYDPHEGHLISKSMEVQKILHRSPDFINLGELSLKDHFTAFLNVLSVGIPSIQTIHGKNPNFLLQRLKDIYQVPLEILQTSIPHVFIELDVFWKRNKKNRMLVKIAELNEQGGISSISNEDINHFLTNDRESSNIFTIRYLLNRNRAENWHKTNT